MASCVIKESAEIRELLVHRMNDASLSYGDVIDDAATHDVTLDKGSLSRFFKTNEKTGYFICDTRNSLKQEDILWLCKRYGIQTHLQVIKLTREQQKTIEMLNGSMGGNPVDEEYVDDLKNKYIKHELGWALVQ